MKHNRNIRPTLREEFAAENRAERARLAQSFRDDIEALRKRMTGKVYVADLECWNKRIAHYERLIASLET